MSQMPTLAALDYLVQVAKDWAENQFAAADGADFALAPHRFELDGAIVRRQPLPAFSLEARLPLKTAPAQDRPSAWIRASTVTITVARGPERVELDHEIVEVTAVDGDVNEVVREAALVARFGDLPPCLGEFRCAA